MGALLVNSGPPRVSPLNLVYLASALGGCAHPASHPYYRSHLLEQIELRHPGEFFQVPSETVSPESFLSEELHRFYRRRQAFHLKRFPFAPDIFQPGTSFIASSINDQILFSNHNWLTHSSEVAEGISISIVRDRVNGGRHPQIWLTFIPFDSETGEPSLPPIWCAGIKGGGLAQLPDPKTGRVGEGVVKLPQGDLILPMYALKGTAQEFHYEYHKLWGGLSLDHAKHEFTNLVALDCLCASACPEVYHLIPYPLQVEKYLRLPVFTKDGNIKYYSIAEYEDTFLDGLKADPSTLVTLSEADLRIETAEGLIRNAGLWMRANGVLCLQNPFFVKNQINSILTLIYKINGYPFVPPSGEHFQDPERTDLDAYAPQILRYLKVCYEENRAAAGKILDSLKMNTLKIMGVLHGAGGHAGGIHQMGFLFTSFTSSFAPRNCSVNGSPRDWDEDVHVPTVRSKNSEVDPRGRQFADVDNWQSSMFVMELLLKGANVGDDAVWPDVTAQHIEGAPIIRNLSDLQFARRERLVNTADIFGGRASTLQFINSLEGIYQDALKSGQKWLLN